MGFDADRSHAGPAAAMRDAESLVQIEMADVGAVVAGAGEPDLRVQIGAVEMNLSAVEVHDLAGSQTWIEVSNTPCVDG